jgi:hypothetical protein
MSHHRTLDPEEADFFYVPLMSTCWFFPVSGARARRGRARLAERRQPGRRLPRAACRPLAPATRPAPADLETPAPPLWLRPPSYPPGWADTPWWYVDTWSRVSHAAVMAQELLDWVKSAHPYWNRTGGADHVWLFAHDEGACWAPAEVYANSVILTHWGRLDRDHASVTSYGQVRRGGAGARLGGGARCACPAPASASGSRLA